MERSDEEQLVWAARELRVLVTHNAADFARLASLWIRDGRSHAGILIARQGPIGWLLREVLGALASRPDSTDLKGQVVWTRRFIRR